MKKDRSIKCYFCRMFRAGILSDTHGFLHPRVLHFFEKVDEIWHAGDIGDLMTADRIAEIKPLVAVYGNIDGQELRLRYPKTVHFQREAVKVMMTHIGGYPGRYDSSVRRVIEEEKPGLFICGHSHILKVMYDKKQKLLHINPGAAGKYGFHTSVTAVRLVLDGNGFRDLEVLDIPRGRMSED